MLSCDLSLLPSPLVDIVYKASLLHLQPRQMRLSLTDLCDERDPFDPGGPWDEEDEGDEEDEIDGAFVREAAAADEEFSALRKGMQTNYARNNRKIEECIHHRFRSVHEG